MPDLSGRTALVTGASSGIGAAIAARLASWKCALVVTARRRDRLDALCHQLSAAHGVRARAIAEDLSDPAGPARLQRAVREDGAAIDILVNNAGFGAYQAFLDTPWERHTELLQLNVTSLVELTYRFLPDLCARPERAHILNVASVAAFVPLPYFANYGATKAYVLSFSQSLAAELRRTRVRVTCLCPGATRTEFSDVAGQTVGRAARAGMMSAERCADVGLHAMLRGRRLSVPGATNKLTRVASSLLPDRLVAAVGTRLIGKPAAATLPPAAER